VTVFGVTCRYLIAVGINLVLGGTIIVALSAWALVPDALIPWVGRFRSTPQGLRGPTRTTLSGGENSQVTLLVGHSPSLCL
jgi:hypothetical protein